MRALIATVLLTVALAGQAAAQSAQPPSPPPPPGSAALFKSAADLAAVLQKATVSTGGTSSAAVTANDQYRVSIVHRDKPAGALTHAGNTELLYITEGAGTIITGGTVVAAAAGKPASIANGVSQHFIKGGRHHRPGWFSTLVRGNRCAGHLPRSTMGRT